MKSEIRALMRQREALLNPADAAAETARIWKEVEDLDSFRYARTVLSYMDIPGEVPTVEFMEKWRTSKRFAIPRVAGDELEFYEYDPARLKKGYRDILEPAPDAIHVSAEDIDFALIPGVAFAFRDGRLWRLGRGKGFYDRTLPRLNCPKRGIFYSFRLLEEIPLDPWDQPL